MTAREFTQWLRERRDPESAMGKARFFQVAPGGYAEHDQFLGLSVPVVRRGVRLFQGLKPGEAAKLVVSPWHEERLAGLLCWVDGFARASLDGVRREIAALYLEHKDHVDNWDLVDSSAHLILGPWWEAHPAPAVFWDLARSAVVWDRRIAVMSTFHGIRHGTPDACVEICTAMLGDSHDLIHKATGWMLRESGKRDPEILRAFLAQHATGMPRTMLRYAIEKLDPAERKIWMDAKKSV